VKIVSGDAVHDTWQKVCMSVQTTGIRSGLAIEISIQMPPSERQFPALRKGETSMSHSQIYEATDLDYGNVSFRRNAPIKSSKQRRPTHGRGRGKSPQSVNGIHRRRNRKLSW